MHLSNGPVATEIEVPGESQITFSLPEEQPTQLIEALIDLLKQHKPVRRAFLIMAHDKNMDEKPNLLIGLEFSETTAENEINSIIQQAGESACEYLDENDSVDFCLLDEKERGISHYLIQHTQPFYQRKLGSWLRGTIPVVNQ
ncbi:enhanced serine sensitivity protein SseB C-terminal domain-containing protein [Xenorhabdus szentirmaii]|uniref:Enhances serine sensitivity n=2 Tax=Xenorhabdus szentirmaii TaxID=290112 RepID=W1ITJ9_9GAMM|nr:MULTISPECIES: enhanced serine sensitivity protein SseB C-terminal domain-containing protein [Xenorhabdus]MBD2782449.1 enhanced serine sensitivity protein SseB C-terminal domain-containing protein [Xenorhabdus sp. 38]MBD2792934.1 enhanced serine sensitivity protein SseB C-terminal domain-containing protein [Xenorhabdus sp. CUL]MBD2800862.1 enhanced serine sensitivity protein SseB C-terminal domain-containing protein [Xenorhabdus sp. M]MBD2806251.1 enhanced serine sensitivity protein SseB C-te